MFKLIKVVSQTLRNIPLLAGMSDEECALLLKELTAEEFPRRETIIRKGSPPESLLFLISGQLQVIDITEDGREVGLRILSPGDFFGEIAIITGGPRTAFVVSLTSAVVAFLPRSLALHLFANSPSIANKMMQLLADKISKDSELRSLLSIQNARRRVFALLDSLITKRITGEKIIERLPTHHEMALMVNTSRETVTRALLSLSQQGVIVRKSHTVVILDHKVLKQLTQES